MKATIFQGFGLDGQQYTFSTCTTNPGWIQSPTPGYYFPSDNNVPIVYNTNFSDRRLLNDYAIFNDFNTYVSLPSIGIQPPYSIQMLIHPRAYNQGSRLIELSNSDGSNFIVITMDLNARILFATKNGASFKSISTNVKIQLNQWKHLTLIHDGTYGYIYYDGNLKTIETLVSNGNIALTNNFIGNNNYNGFIDDVRIWNRVLTTNEIINGFKSELVGNESGLIRYYKFNNNLNDSTVNNAHGSNNNVRFSTIERKNINLLPLNIFIVDNYIDYRNKLLAKKENNLGDCYQCLKQKCYKFVAKTIDDQKMVFTECCTVPGWLRSPLEGLNLLTMVMGFQSSGTLRWGK